MATGGFRLRSMNYKVVLRRDSVINHIDKGLVLVLIDELMK